MILTQGTRTGFVAFADSCEAARHFSLEIDSPSLLPSIVHQALPQWRRYGNGGRVNLAGRRQDGAGVAAMEYEWQRLLWLLQGHRTLVDTLGNRLLTFLTGESNNLNAVCSYSI